MARKLVDFDSFTGTATYHEDVGETDFVTTEQDVQPVIERATKLRNEGVKDKDNGGARLKHYCELPNVVIMQLRKKGINMMNPRKEDWDRFFPEIETNYPYLKVANWKGWRPKGLKVAK